MTRLESITVDIGGVTAYPTSLQITSGIGKGYNTCTMSGIYLIGNVGDNITININGQVFYFILDEKNFNGNGKVSMTAYGKPIILTDYVAVNTDYSYSNSNELINDAKSSIVVVNNLPLIEFTNQSYSKDSSALDRISDMVSVVKGDMYEVGGELYLDELNTISSNEPVAYTFSDSEVFSQSYTDKRDKSEKAKYVLINPITDDLISTSQVALEFSEDDKRGIVLFNPSLSKGFNYIINGLDDRSPTPTIVEEKIAINNESFFMTKGGIDSIETLKFNGDVLVLDTDYFTYSGYNVIRFNNKLTGSISIRYYSKAVAVYTSMTTSFSVVYQCQRINGIIEIKDDGSTNGDSFVGSSQDFIDILDPLTYENGGSIEHTLDRDITLLFLEEKGSQNVVDFAQISSTSTGKYINIKYAYSTTDLSDTDKSFMNNISDEKISKIVTEQHEIIYDSELNDYVTHLDHNPTSINAVFYGSQAITNYTLHSDTNSYISFSSSDIGKTVDISMNIDIVKITIPAPLSGNVLTLLDAIGDIGIATKQITHAEDNLCSLPSTFNVNIASSFDIAIADVYGKEVTGDFGSLIVDNFGNVNVTVTEAKVYTIICDNIKVGGKITLDAVGVV